jgi:DinB superfamily
MKGNAMKETVKGIREAILLAEPELLKISPERSRLKTNPASWSKKEILGHLVDSALNNHQRVVRGAQNLAADFPGYDQNRWVEVQNYSEIEWHELIGLFTTLNRHLCRVIENLPEEALNNECNFGSHGRVPLQFVIQDYLRHLKHHLEKIIL